MWSNTSATLLMRAASHKIFARRMAGAALVFVMGCAPAFGAAPASADATVRIDAQTKAVIKGGLKYLAGQQHLDGSWSVKEGTQGYPVAMTGYVLLAFMANGNLPDAGDYSKNMVSGMQYLLDKVQPDGLFQNVTSGQYMYQHGIATIALAEMYGAGQSPVIRPKLERLVNVILKAQAPDGGWRYTPKPKDSDVSATVMQAVALRAAQEAGISVPQDAITKALEYVSSCYDAPTGGFRYQPGVKEPGFARTAAAIYSLQVLGKFDDPKVKSGSAFLFTNAKRRDNFWIYGCYYAAPAQYMIGGETWRRWYEEMKGVLLGDVQRSGDLAHWEPKNPKDDLGPVYCTAVFVHILAMPYHYLPLYQR